MSANATLMESHYFFNIFLFSTLRTQKLRRFPKRFMTQNHRFRLVSTTILPVFHYESRLINCFLSLITAHNLRHSGVRSESERHFQSTSKFRRLEALRHLVINSIFFPIQGLPQTVSGHQVISSASESSVKDFESDENVS